MFSSFRANIRSTGVLVEAVLLVFSRKLDSLSCLSSQGEGTNGSRRTVLLEVELLEAAAWTGYARTPAPRETHFLLPARILTLLNSLSGTTPSCTLP